MLLIIEKGMREGMCNAMHRYAKTSNKYMKNYIKNKESSYIQYFGENNLYRCVMPQRLPEWWFWVGWRSINYWWKT